MVDGIKLRLRIGCLPTSGLETPQRRAVASRDRAGAPERAKRDATVYECPTCETRYLANQYCSDRRTFCRRVGCGGGCPHCDEPVAINDLLVATA